MKNNISNLILEHFNNKKYENALSIICKVLGFAQSDIENRLSVLLVNEWDMVCYRIGQQILSEQINSQHVTKCFDRQTIVYLASELYLSGGHTRCLEQFIAAESTKQHIVILTSQNPQDFERIKELRFNFPNVTFELYKNKELSFVDKIKWIQSRLMALKPERCFLFHHPNDVSVIGAIQSNIVNQVYLYHHSDSSPTLGLTLDHVKIIELYKSHYYHTSKQVNHDRLIYLPLTIDSPNKKPTFKPHVNNIIVSASSNSSYFKLEQPYHYDFYDSVIQLLKKTRGIHILIGSYNKEKITHVVTKIKEFGLDEKHIIHVPYVPDLASALEYWNVNLFVGGIPLSGGLTLIEVMSRGIPIIHHVSYTHYKLASPDLCYETALFWRNNDDFNEILDSLTIENLAVQSKESYNHYVRIHHPKNLKKYLNEPIIYGRKIDLKKVKKQIKSFMQKDELKVYLDTLEKKI
jgi:hypothetical protein